MLKGRLGLETAQVPHSDRLGLLWLERGKLSVENGNLTFVAAGGGLFRAGTYQIPFQTISYILIGPGVSLTHDVLRLLARHGTGMAAFGENGVRLYASMPFGPDRSELARRQATLWADERSRIAVAKHMYEIRMGEVLPQGDINALRGIEGHRMKSVYKSLGQKFNVDWSGRKFDRNNPENDNDINSAINHASAAVRSAGMVAVAISGAIPQLGFIHETSGHAFALDIADLFRASITLPAAFAATAESRSNGDPDIERLVRKETGQRLWKEKVIHQMISNIKRLIYADDNSSDEELTSSV